MLYEMVERAGEEGRMNVVAPAPRWSFGWPGDTSTGRRLVLDVIESRRFLFYISRGTGGLEFEAGTHGSGADIVRGGNI